MKEQLNDRQIERLLSGKDQLSITEKEELFGRILRRAAPKRRIRMGRWTALALASSAFATLVVGIGLIDRSGSEFTARGGQAPSSSFSLACIENERPSPCRPDGKLSFKLDPAGDSRYFAAFARRSDRTIIWYYPEEVSRSLSIAGQTEKQLLTKGIRLGPEHPPGLYAIYGVFTKNPLTRNEIKAALGDALAGNGTIQVVRRDLVIEKPR